VAFAGYFAQVYFSAAGAFFMSMEIYLLTNVDAPSMQEWQRAIDALAFDVRFLDKREFPNETRFKTECQGKPVLMELMRVDLAYVRDVSCLRSQ
jgi:hypothetical protein